MNSVIRDDPGKDIEPAGTALGVAFARNFGWEGQFLFEGHDVDTAPLKQRPASQVDLVDVKGFELGCDCGASGRKKACANAVRNRTQPEVKAGRLNLLVANRVRGP